jgi:hypothetical protein
MTLRSPGGPRVALATCSQFPQLPDDETLLLDALRERGIAAEPAVWDDRSQDWQRFSLVVVRSTWDYVPHREQFVAWASSLPWLLNSAEVIAWNTDKRYLRELPGAVATQFVTPGESWEPPPGEYVLKPTVSAGSRGTARYSPGQEEQARAHLGALLAAERTVMVQPYLSAVDDSGETALVFFDGEFSHAIRKGPLLAPSSGPSNALFVKEDVSARRPRAEELAFAETVLGGLRWSREQLLYARVDLIPAADGTPQLVELELTEPSLFLSHDDAAAGRLADCVVGRLRNTDAQDRVAGV